MRCTVFVYFILSYTFMKKIINSLCFALCVSIAMPALAGANVSLLKAKESMSWMVSRATLGPEKFDGTRNAESIYALWRSNGGNNTTECLIGQGPGNPTPSRACDLNPPLTRTWTDNNAFNPQVSGSQNATAFQRLSYVNPATSTLAIKLSSNYNNHTATLKISPPSANQKDVDFLDHPGKFVKHDNVNGFKRLNVRYKYSVGKNHGNSGWIMQYLDANSTWNTVFVDKPTNDTSGIKLRYVKLPCAAAVHKKIALIGQKKFFKVRWSYGNNGYSETAIQGCKAAGKGAIFRQFPMQSFVEYCEPIELGYEEEDFTQEFDLPFSITTSETGTFHTDSACASDPISEVSIPAEQESVFFYYKPTNSSDHEITATAQYDIYDVTLIAQDAMIVESTIGGVEDYCNDLIDNDNDGYTDCADDDCSADPMCMGNETECDDLIDNDNDGYTDCADNDCSADPMCMM